MRFSSRVSRAHLVARVAVAMILTLAATAVGHAAPPRADLVITGTVTTEAKQPIFGANVVIDAFAISVGTDQNGRYTITVPAARRGPQVVIRARSFGYIPQVRSIATAGADTMTVDFAMKQDVNRLSQVIVTGVTGASSLYGRSYGAHVVGASDPRDLSGESYGRIKDNEFRSPRVAPLSTFGVDVDRASYSNVRRIVTVDRQHPPKDAVRIEEFINYFPYAYAGPRDEHPFAVHTAVAPAPWAPEHRLVRIALQAETIDLDEAPANNLVFLLDVSGSMYSPDKLPLLKTAFRMLVEQLREQDRVAIVVYAGSEGLALPSTSGADKPTILGVLDRLESGGSTAGGAGIRLAYDIAKANVIPDGNNRVILATDGDFNVGVTSNAELERLVEQRREEGTALSVLAFGAGNIKDDRMEMLADKGNGNYAYIDSPLEARKVLVSEMGGTLVTVAKDVKLQVEFNPASVAAYRLIGYENRLLADEDFKDDKKDAGDIGAGHSVTALYEIVPVGASDARKVRLTDERRYARVPAPRRNADELMLVRLRYKPPKGSASTELQRIVRNEASEADEDFRWAQAVVAFGMTLRDSEHRGTASTAMALELAHGARGRDAGGYRADFIALVKAYDALPAVVAERRDK